MSPEEKQMRRQRAKSMADHPSRRRHFDLWEQQFREMDKDDEALHIFSNNTDTDTDGHRH